MSLELRLNAKTAEAAKTDRLLLSHIRRAFSNDFDVFFSERGWRRHDPGEIIPEYDDSVLFTGSAISTLKPYLGCVPEEGFWIVQQCLRTQNTQLLLKSSRELQWASYFKTVGCLSNSNDLERLSEDIWEFFTNCIAIPRERIRVRIRSQDHDLLTFWLGRRLAQHLEIDANEGAYYRHKFGIDGIVGRNLNLAVVHNITGELRDIGNIIVIERDSHPIAAEAAFGIETTLSRILDFSTPLEASLIGDCIPISDRESAKLADALSTTIVLLRAGIRPVVSNRGRILRKYLQALSPLRVNSGRSIEDLGVYSLEFEDKEFGSTSGIPERICVYLKEFERLSADKCLRKDQINSKLSKIF